MSGLATAFSLSKSLSVTFSPPLLAIALFSASSVSKIFNFCSKLIKLNP